MRKKRIKELGIFIAYALLYVALREVSLPHWNISTGLRLGALLLLPIDFWPVVIAADCTGTLIYKWNALHDGNAYWFMWAMVVPSFLAPIPAYLLRMTGWCNPSTSTTRSTSLILKACALLALLLSGAGVIAFSIINFGQGAKHMEGGPVHWFFVYFIGHYLGALMLVPLVVTYQWVKRAKFVAIVIEFQQARRHALIEIGMAACAIIALTAINLSTTDRIVEVATSLLMMFPAVLVANRRGWIAAVVLTCLSNVALRATLRHPYDTDFILLQILLMTVVTNVLGTGARVSNLFARLLSYDRERDSNLSLARQTLSWGDGMVRRGAIDLEQRYRLLEEIREVHEDSLELSAAANAGMKWSLGLAPTFKLPPSIEILKADPIETMGLRGALRFGPLAEQLEQSDIFYRASVSSRARANSLPSAMELRIYQISNELVLNLCHRYKARRVALKLRILNHASRTVVLQVRVWPGNQDVSKLPGVCHNIDAIRALSKTYNGKLKDKTYLDQPCVTVFLRDS